MKIWNKLSTKNLLRR